MSERTQLARLFAEYRKASAALLTCRYDTRDARKASAEIQAALDASILAICAFPARSRDTQSSKAGLLLPMTNVGFAPDRVRALLQSMIDADEVRRPRHQEREQGVATS